MKLNLACGSHKRDGWVNVDVAPGCKPDVVADLFSPDWWKQFGEDSVDEMYVGHFLEHIPHASPVPGKDGIFVFFDACYRVMKDGAKVSVVYPCHKSDWLWIDPTHCRGITGLSFRYYDATWRKQAETDYYPIECDFSYERVRMNVMEAKWLDKPIEQRQQAVMNLWNVVAEEEICMTCHKPARQERLYTGP